jgi:hypothetical protein
MKDLKELEIILTNEEWTEQMDNLVISGNGRKRFSTHFDDVLSFKLQKQYSINCWFRSK